MSKQAEQLELVVTRYADDITVSGANTTGLLKFETSLKAALATNRGVALELNDKKRGLYGPGERRMVTGLIITPDRHVSIGRERKRLISSLIHHFALRNQEANETMRTKGLLAFAQSVEPEFFTRMKEKYGDDMIERLMRTGPDIDSSLHGIDF